MNLTNDKKTNKRTYTTHSFIDVQIYFILSTNFFDRCCKSSVRKIQGKVDRSDPVLISLCSSVVQYGTDPVPKCAREYCRSGPARVLIAC